MTKIRELVKQYKAGELEFEALLEIVPTLNWAVERETSDGEIWFDGENTVASVDAMCFENEITQEEKRAIFAAIP